MTSDKMYFCVCCICGIEFGVPDHYDTHRREKGGDFYCPNGHVLNYGEGSLNRELKRKSLQLQQKSEQLQACCHEIKDLKAQLLKQQKRSRPKKLKEIPAVTSKGNAL